MLSVLRALHISLATCARSSFLPVFWPLSNFFFVCTHGLSQKKRVCLPLALCRAQPIWSESTSVVVSVWTSFWRPNFPLKSSEMLWKRWSQSIRNWSYTPLCTVFTGLWLAVILRWVSSSARLRNSFEHWEWGHSKVPLTSSALPW